MARLKWSTFLAWLLLVFIYTTLAGGAQNQCHIGDIPLGNIIPRAGFEVENMQFLGEGATVHLATDCVLKCCELGPEQCQYVWILWKRCYAVSCSHQSAECQPMEIPFVTDFDSIYFQVNWSSGEPVPPTELGHEGAGGREGVQDPEEAGGHEGVQDPEGAGGHEGVQDPEGAGGREGGTEEPEGVENHGGREGELGDAGVTGQVPPLANAGPDVTITYPDQTSVILTGSQSSGDIIYFLWQLTSEDHPDQATLINPTLPDLEVLNLTPGEYTFTLTVADSSFHTSTDTVKVLVVQASTTPTPPSPTSQASQTNPTSPTSPTTPSRHGVVSTGNQEIATDNSSAVVEGESQLKSDDDGSYSKRSNLLKIAVPVLICVAIILILSAVIVGMAFCLCERSRRRMTHTYHYKKLPGTIEKT